MTSTIVVMTVAFDASVTVTATALMMSSPDCYGKLFYQDVCYKELPGAGFPGCPLMLEKETHPLKRDFDQKLGQNRKLGKLFGEKVALALLLRFQDAAAPQDSGRARSAQGRPTSICVPGNNTARHSKTHPKNPDRSCSQYSD